MNLDIYNKAAELLRQDADAVRQASVDYDAGLFPIDEQTTAARFYGVTPEGELLWREDETFWLWSDENNIRAVDTPGHAPWPRVPGLLGDLIRGRVGDWWVVRDLTTGQAALVQATSSYGALAAIPQTHGQRAMAFHPGRNPDSWLTTINGRYYREADLWSIR